jgi:hypothetical protein
VTDVLQQVFKGLDHGVGHLAYIPTKKTA